jgi:hypothetical protein
VSENEIDDITVLLICREGISRQVYRAETDFFGVMLVCVESLMEFFSHSLYCPLSGIMVDMPTYLRSSEEERSLLSELVALFPSLRLKCHEPSGEVRTLPFGTGCSGNLTLSGFLTQYCKPFTKRKIRTSERSLQNLSALCNIESTAAVSASVKTVTTSLSCVGCFLVGFDPQTVGASGWLTILDIKDTTPIPVEVCSIRVWGESRTLPGIGVRFTGLTKIQKDELIRLGGRSFMPDPC